MSDHPSPTAAASGATRQLAEFASALRFEDIPAPLVERIKLHMLDGIGVCLHGAAQPWTRRLADFVRSEGGASVATLWGHAHKVSASQAALVNGTAGHAFEMDDIHKDSVLHPNSIALPVALALAESNDWSDGKELLTAVVAGYEIGPRVGNAATTALFLNGFHPQGTTGAFVAAATAARLMRLDAPATQHALGIAGSMGAGLMAAQEGAMVKRLHCGRAAQAGLQAAALAQRGFTGIVNVLEAPYGGFLSTLSRSPRPERLTDGLGIEWEAGQVGFKLYPNVTSIHAALDALLHLQKAHGLVASEIARIDVGCGHMTFVHTAWPYQPEGVTSAQMNLFYGLSVMALRGEVTAADYAEDRIADPDVLAFAARIHPFEDPEIEQRGPASRHAARLQVHKHDGTVLTHDVWDRRGSPESGTPAAEMQAKFLRNVSGIWTDQQAQRAIELVAHLEAPGQVKALIEQLQETRHAL